MDWIDKASACPVLQGIDSEKFMEIMSQLNFQLRSFKKEQLIASQGEKVQALMILIEGSVRGEMTDYSGRMIKIEDIHAPKPIAGAFIFGKHNDFPVTIISNEPVRILYIKKDEFLKLLQLSPEIQLNYLNLISSKAQFLSHKIQFLSLKNLKGKIAHYLLGLDPDSAGTLQIPETQKALSELFGVARPSVARGFKQLEEEGIIEVKNRMVKVLKPQLLLGYLRE
jgi:CRP-like cAMP-binding protein